MFIKKIYVFYNDKTVVDNGEEGYISKEEFTRRCEEEFGSTLNLSFVKIREEEEGCKLQDEIGEEKCLSECLFLAVGDKTTTQFSKYPEGKKLMWLPILAAGSGLGNNKPKLWFSQKLECAMLANYLLENNIQNIVVLEREQEGYCQAWEKDVKAVLTKCGLSYTERKQNEAKCAYFVAGFGDSMHLEKIKTIIEENEEVLILTNSAIILQEDALKVLTKNKSNSSVVCVYLSQGKNCKDTNKRWLEEQYIKDTFKLIKRYNNSQSNNESIDNYLIEHRYFDGLGVNNKGIVFDNNGYLVEPLIIKQIKNGEGIDKKCITLSKQLDNYEVAEFVQATGEEIKKIDHTSNEYPIFKLIPEFYKDILFVEAQISYNDTIKVLYDSIDNADSRNMFQEILNSYICEQREGDFQQPIQINLREVDVADNGTIHFCLRKNDDYVFPVNLLKNNNDIELKFDYCLSGDIYNDQFKEIVIQKNIDVRNTINKLGTAHIDLKYLYLFPCSVAKKGSNGFVGLGAKSKLNLLDVQLVKDLVNQSLSLLMVYNINAMISYESVKSAKAAIMSRNMSHNLGSQVIAYLKQNLHSVSEIIENGVLNRLLENKDDFIDLFSERRRDFIERRNMSVANVTLPFMIGMGYFLSYLQERQDFIATVATDYVPYCSAVNFKDFIYDALNPDKRYERHKAERHDEEIDNILLGFIAKSEGFGRELPSCSRKDKQCKHGDYDIILKFRSFNGNPIDESTEEGRKAKEDLDAMREYNFSLPGGVVGRQAIFSIIENVIRNAAKHGGEAIKNDTIGRLELTFDIIDPSTVKEKSKDPEYKELVEFLQGGESNDKDNVSENYFEKSDIDNLLIITLTNNVPTSPVTLQKIREAIKEEYVDSSGKMLDSNKGIKELRISAAWLRSITNDLEIRDRVPVLNARLDKGCLQYIFCVNKLREVAIFYKKKLELPLTFKQFESYNEFFKEKNKSFDCIIVDNNDIEAFPSNEIDKIYMQFSQKIILLSELPKNIQDIILQKDKPELFDCKDKNNQTDPQYLENYRFTVQCELYKYLSKYSEGDVIGIEDDKTLGLYKNEEGKIAALLEQHVNLGKNIGEKYLYRTHHDTQEEFTKFVDSDYKVDFVEGISGGNSTDRLVRNNSINELWFYRHLYAMKQRVAIIDERLFTRIFGLGEQDLINSSNEIEEDQDAFEEKKKEVAEQYPRYQKGITSTLDCRDLCRYLEDIGVKTEIIENVKQALTSKKIRKNFCEEYILNNYKGIVFQQKGVYIFTLIQDKNKFNLYGLDINPGSLDEYRKSHKCRCIRWGDFSWDGKQLTFNPSSLILEIYGNTKQNGYTSITQFTSPFNFLSIHQGLLDKMYNVFEINNLPKYTDEEKQVNLAKKAVTNGLYEWFMPTSDKLNYCFMPQRCIHSGRSKPGTDDMPQKIPFIQYSAIEHAVMDCKYSLIELLTSAKYE